MKILVVSPVNTKVWNKPLTDYFNQIKAEGTEVEVRNISKGAESIEQTYDWLQNSPYVLEEAKKAEKDGFDAVILNCFANLVVEGLREDLDIPVVAIDESAFNLALMLGRKFSILGLLENEKTMATNRVAMLGLTDRLVSVRSIDIPVLELRSSKRFVERLLEEGRKAIEEGADTLVLGCGGMIGVANKMSKELGVPVVDPTAASMKMAEALVTLGLSHSKKVYIKPREKKRVVDYP